MKYPQIVRSLNSICLASLAAGLLLAGCDSAVTGPEGEVTFEGRVTGEPGFGKASAAADVEGAVVTAANVMADGSLEPLDGQATTNAEGEFSLRVTGAANDMVLLAVKDAFESKVMVYHRGSSTVDTVPMTTETHAEADVYVEARNQDAQGPVTMADVAVFVTEQVGADVRSGSRAAADVAAALRAEAEARMEYVRQAEGEEKAESVLDAQNDAYIELQVGLSASTDTESEAAAITNFELALIDAYSEAGVSFETQAEARIAGRSALLHFGEASFGMRKVAEVLVSTATAFAVESSFAVAGASEDRLSALATARAELVAGIRAAVSADAINAAFADYEARVRAELAAEAGLDESVLVDASNSTLINAARATLQSTLATAATGGVVAEAHATFFVVAKSSAEGELSSETEDASFAADVLVLTSIS